MKNLKKPKPLNKRIIVLSDDDLHWGFNNGSSRANYNLRTPNADWPHAVYVDPFPCYSLDREIVERVAAKVEDIFPVPFKPTYFILAHEFDDRCNGCATYNHVHLDHADRPLPIDPIIMFSGKRIPIHPGMQEYLVAHEYGHVVDYNITYMRRQEINAMDEEYAKMRGIKMSQKYGGRSWHSNIGEILVNDFRIACTNIEPCFWPHDVPHPLDNEDVQEFWAEMKKQYAKETFPIWMEEKSK